MLCTPFSFVTAARRSASAAVIVIGFSTAYGLPASAAASAIS